MQEVTSDGEVLTIANEDTDLVIRGSYDVRFRDFRVFTFRGKRIAEADLVMNFEDIPDMFHSVIANILLRESERIALDGAFYTPPPDSPKPEPKRSWWERWRRRKLQGGKLSFSRNR